jgi:hypothetical protein
MSELRDFLPPPPWEGPPLPRFVTKGEEPREPVNPPQVQYSQCEDGIDCIKNHMLRAHLYMTEAIRFSAGGDITEDAQVKIRSAKEQLLCEDDFQAAMGAPPETRGEVLKLLASARSTWKAVDQSGLDEGFGTPEDVQELADAIHLLSRKAYEIDRQYRLNKS